MMLVDEIKYLLKQYGIRPSKSKGQNFLINQDIIQQIIKANFRRGYFEN
ncbi:MAG: hypothetical protein NT116_03825 [Candidatus Parcubacteria bacterium]|nr:hypothetical protein [Candidatus Parcubacteria bacterium]